MRVAPLLILLLAAVPLKGQPAAEGIFLDLLAMRDDSGGSRLDIYSVVPYAALEFERRGGAFAARYQLRLSLHRGDTVVIDTTHVRELSTWSLDQTNGSLPALEFYQHRFKVAPGSYAVTLEVIDLRTNAVTTIRRSILLPSFPSESIAISTPMLVSRVREDSTGGYAITPSLSDELDVGPPFFLFFEIYSPAPIDSARLIATLVNDDGKEAADGRTIVRDLHAGRTQQWIQLPTEGLAGGRLNARVVVTSATGSPPLAHAERTVTLRGPFRGVALSERELDHRILQLRYVATQREIDEMREAPSLARRQRLYAEFWSRLDPTPSSPENEALEEYQRRVEHANATFGSHAPGWLTDRGRVYIIFGSPDNTSADPFRSDGKRIETWYYARRGVRLTFVDETGFGDYRLVTPLPFGEKFRYP